MSAYSLVRPCRILVSLLFCCSFQISTSFGVTSQEVKALLEEPPTDYSSAPLWVWNDEHTPNQVVTSLRELAAQNVKMAFVHPRPGLMVPYLSDRWFELWDAALEEAQRLGMKLWIYDENSYPSGFGGGFVPDAMPECHAVGLDFETAKTPPQRTGEAIASYWVAKDSFKRIKDGATISADSSISPGAGAKCLLFKTAASPTTPWLGGRFYVDLMRPGVTKKFLELTHDVYARRMGRHFGKLIPGVFTDEPNVGEAGKLPWTPDLPAVFKQKWGYDLLDHLPCLVERVGDFRRVRHNYWRVVLDLFIENWSKPYHDWCEQHKLEFTGHYWEHDWPRAKGVPDNMAMYAWHHRPAIDILFNQYNEGVNAQFGSTRAVKELASVANQLGMKRTLCEAYGAAGWELRFEDMKRIADWLLVLGVNTIDQHIADISIRGARKHDHPQSFSYHEPWWPDYHIQGMYLARLSTVMSQGEQVNTVLLIEPTSTAWMYNAAGAADPQLMEVGNSFQALVHTLEMQQVEFDIGCEDIIARHGSGRTGEFRVGRRGYGCVVLPPHTENLEARTVELIETFVSGGGKVLCAGDPPRYVDGRPSDRLNVLSPKSGWLRTSKEELVDKLRRQLNPDLAIERAGGDKGILFHHRRVLDDGQILLLVNTSITEASSGKVSATAAGIERWDLTGGKPAPYPFERSGDGLNASFTLPPCGSLVLFVSKDRKIEPGPRVVEKAVKVSAEPPTIRRLDPNVLTLDYVDLTAAGQTDTGINVIRAANRVYERHGMGRNPWDRAVQFKDELIRKTFPADSGFAVTYRFEIEGSVPSDLSLVVERADLYTVTCNGQPIAVRKDQWWLDRSFVRMHIEKAAKVGPNEVTLTARPLTMYHEVDNAYVIGDFNLRSVGHGFVIVPAEPMRLGAWNEQGLSLYGGAVAYRTEFDAGDSPGRVRVRLPRWYGSVARVLINGEPAGHIAYAPWECDLAGKVRNGRNTLEIVVIGTLKNTLGPHHNNQALGLAGPGSWDNAPAQGPPPGAGYSTVAYGLWEPPILERIESSRD